MYGIRQEIRIPDLNEPLSHYTDGVRCGDFLFISGKAPLDKEGKLVGVGDVVKQCRQVFENIKKVLDAANMSFADIAAVTIYLLDVNDRPKINPVRKEFFGPHRPTSTLIGVKQLAVPGMLIEIQSVAYKPGSREGKKT